MKQVPRDDDGERDMGASEPVIVPPGELSPAALHGVVEAFVLREGTDYGEVDVSLARKVNDVLAQLERGEARIVYSAETESVDIVLVPQRERHR